MNKLLFPTLAISALVLGGYFFVPKMYSTKYSVKSEQNSNQEQSEITPKNLEEQKPVEPEKPAEVPITHIETPKQVKAIYMSSWVAGTTDFRDRVIKIIDETEVNAVVLDIKDYTGRISYEPTDPYLQKIGSGEKRIRDIRALTNLLHSKGIYIIGRVAVFQDPYLIQQRPDLAVKRMSDKGVWRDHKNIGWIDAGSQDAWDYAIAIGKDSYSQGFDEINYDYIRFPSDGNMKDIYFPISQGKPKPEVLKGFFVYLHKNLKDTGIKTSADVFGMVATNTDDLNIGQVLENTVPYFDYVYPMVYPSHFPNGWNGIKNPATKPYDVIKYSMGKAVERVKAMGENPKKLRPWLQDFDLGATYTPALVRAQIQATYDVGLDSWLLWDPSNKYTIDALQKN